MGSFNEARTILGSKTNPAFSVCSFASRKIYFSDSMEGAECTFENFKQKKRKLMDMEASSFYLNK